MPCNLGTENGTTIDLFDTRGIQTPVTDDGLSFEACWGPVGAAIPPLLKFNPVEVVRVEILVRRRAG